MRQESCCEFEASPGYREDLSKKMGVGGKEREKEKREKFVGCSYSKVVRTVYNTNAHFRQTSESKSKTNLSRHKKGNHKTSRSHSS